MNKFIVTAVSVSVLLLTQTLHAASFQNFEQDESSLGNAHAGDAAKADNAATEYTNPAGMVRLDRPQISFGSAGIFSLNRFNGEIVDANYTPYLEPNGKGRGAVWVPNFHFATPLSARLAFGLGLTTPFAWENHYDPSSPITYASKSTSLKTYNVGPNLAYAVTDQFSIGAGLDAEFLQGEIDQFSSPVQGMSSQNKFSGTGYGYNLGLMYQFYPGNRMGLTYRSPIRIGAKGSSVAVGPNVSPNPYNSQMSTAITMPATITYSEYHDLNKSWTVLGTVTYTLWHSVQNLVLNNVASPDPAFFSGTPTLNLVLPQHFRDAFSLALGTNYRFTRQAMLRLGLGYDQSPVNKTDRNLAFNDGDHIILAVGAHYQALENLGFDLGYAHHFILRTDIVNTAGLGTPNQIFSNYQVGRAVASADVVGLQVDWKFGRAIKQVKDEAK